MPDNYEDVCSCCGGQQIDPGYFICEKCRRKMRELRDREVVEQKESENQGR